MKDLWETTKDVGLVFKDAFAIFQEVTGVLSGDTSLQTTEVNFESVAKTVKHTVDWVDDLVKSILHLEEALLHLDFSKLTGGDLAHLGEAALLTGTGRGLAMKGLKGLLGAGSGAAAEGGAAAAGVGLAPLAAVGAGVFGGYELYKHRDAVEAAGHGPGGRSTFHSGSSQTSYCSAERSRPAQSERRRNRTPDWPRPFPSL